MQNPRNYKHGFKGTHFYRVWQNMKNRCLNPRSSFYINYGGRGIKVCDRWQKFENFRDDMYESYQVHVKKFGAGSNTQIERQNNDNDYEPSNCLWVTQKTQMRNTRRNHIIEYDGLALPLTAMAEHHGIPERVLSLRINRLKWPIAKALKTSVIQNHNKNTKLFKLASYGPAARQMPGLRHRV